MSFQFPNNFIWGVATSAYQIEGGWNRGGKGPSIWDVFCQIPGKISNADTGNIACNHIELYKEDVGLIKAMGSGAYRFSLSWPRIMPAGSGSVNQEGIDFYNRLIDLLLEHQIDPWVTLYHWDLPLALQFEEDGWLGDDIDKRFADYAEVCFRAFGDRVKNWITLNEPWVVAMLGYGQGIFAPGRVSNTEPYLAGHKLLQAHGRAVEVYRNGFQSTQGGRIGITNNCDWREPLTNSEQDVNAAQRALDFFLGWFADPIYKGVYPQTMIERLGERLPKFSEDDIKRLKGSSDFFGLNHYTTMYAAHTEKGNIGQSVYGNGGLSEDQDVSLSHDESWKKTSMGWAIVPWGCTKLLKWIAERYDNPPIIITENGCAFDDELIAEDVNDQERVEFFDGYLKACADAIRDGVNLEGYFAWSLMDNFEWASGYSKRFGLHYVDFESLKRTPKASAKWLSKVFKENKI